MHFRNHGVGVNDAVMDIGNDYVGIYRELDLQLNSKK